MMIGKYYLAARTIAVIAVIAALMLLAALVPGCIQKHRSQAAQARLDNAQAQAASDSAKDAINATAAAGARETASEDMTRTNDSRIRASEGAGVRVGAGVNMEGRRALCRRVVYRDDPKCAMFKGAK